MPTDIKQTVLDFDGSFSEEKAEKHDGYIETDDAVLSITQGAVFPIAPPIMFDSLADLLEIDTPDIYLGDCEVGAVSFRNDFLPVEHATVSGPDTRHERIKQEALALMRVRRQTVMKESAESNHRERARSSAFWILSIAVGSTGVFAVLAIMAMRWARLESI